MLQRLKQQLENESDQKGGGEHLALLGTFLRRNLHREFVAKETNVFIQTQYIKSRHARIHAFESGQPRPISTIYLLNN